MENIIQNLQNDFSSAFYFIIPLLGSFLFWKFNHKITRNTLTNIFYYLISTLGLILSIIAIYGSLYSLLYHSVGLNIASQTLVNILIAIIILSLIVTNIERQSFFKTVYSDEFKKKTQEQMVTTVSKVTKSARTEVLMFCGVMSFIERDYEQFSSLQKVKCEVKALCKYSDDDSIKRHFNLAKQLGIKIKYYPDTDCDPGIRGRIIDSNDPNNRASILIVKNLDNNGELIYGTKYNSGLQDSYELDLLIKIFNLLWKYGYE